MSLGEATFSLETSVNDNNFINDIRTLSDFKGNTFSNYKKLEVRNQLIQSMLKGKIEYANNWCAELICAGCYSDLWETIIYFICKHIHLANPRIVVYIETRFHLFKNIMNQGLFASEIQLRNDDKIRKLFAEIITIITISNKKYSFETIKINREEEFDITQMTERLKASNTKFIEEIFQDEDPKELFIAANEFAFHISEHEKPNMHFACYWLEWIIEFDIICKKKKQPCLCKRRLNIDVEYKYKRDIIWIVWDILFHYMFIIEPNGGFKSKILHSLLNLFCMKYTTATCKKRRYLLYFAIAILTEHISYDIEMITNKDIVVNVLNNIGDIYKHIKLNEISPKTDYLFHNLDKNKNLSNSIRQIQIMNELDIIPRV